MSAQAHRTDPAEVLPFRVRFRAEMNRQIVHDLIHTRAGWAITYRLELDQRPVGFGSIAIDGPWKDRPTAYEFYVLPEFRPRGFELFESFLAASGARHLEVQSNEPLLPELLHAYGDHVTSEAIVFEDAQITCLPARGSALRAPADIDAVRRNLETRRGGGEWQLELDGQLIGRGGILYHYNRPFGDIHMEIAEPWRRKGFGAYLVQELKRVCHELGAIPAARCNTRNVASRRTLTRAGFAPCAHMLLADLRPAAAGP
jgi:RimJ/RimL family protein N-acetyltransferase